LFDFFLSQNQQNTQNHILVGESGQLARFLAATRLRAAIRFSLELFIVLQVLNVL
jgi:hypothetical protein